MGRDWPTTNLKATPVRTKVKDNCSLFCGSFLSTANVHSDSEQINTWHTTNISVLSANRSTSGTPPSALRQQTYQHLAHHQHQRYINKQTNTWHTTSVSVTSEKQIITWHTTNISRQIKTWLSTNISVMSASRSTPGTPPTSGLRQHTDQHMEHHQHRCYVRKQINSWHTTISVT